jgi:stalled ribosome rescue protein Dom34
MTFYNLPEVETKIDFDKKTKVLRITGITEHDRVITHTDNGVTNAVTIELEVR